MQFRRNHSTRDFLGTSFFGPIVIGILLLSGVMLWVQGEIPVNAHEPLSILGVIIMVVVFFISLLIAKQRFKSPWYVHISGTDDAYTFIARCSKDNVIIKKTNLISTQLLHHSLSGVSYVGVKITYQDNGERSYLIISGAGSWYNQSGKILRQKHFCEALVAALTA